MQPVATHNGVPVLGPQPGPQTQMITSPADIVIGGGAAGGGKSVWLILEGGKFIHQKDFTGVIFRRQYKEVIEAGGLWDTSLDIYGALGGHGVRGDTRWTFPASASLKMDHLNTESDKNTHQGLAYTYLAFDELTHFSRSQFFYLLTRNRNFGECRVKPYCRCSCNPDADSWVAGFISWWWDSDTGYPIPERQGVIRYFIRNDDDEIEWVDKDYRDINDDPPTSITFIASMLEDNKLMPNMSQYRSGIMKNSKVVRERLSKGNWLISESGGMFDPAWFEIADEAPKDMKSIRYWDMAATEMDEEEQLDPDWTAGALCGISDGILYIVDMNSFREKPGTAEKLMKQTAQMDGRDVGICWEEEKGSSGKFVTEYLKQVFKGFNASPDPVQGKKEERARPWAAWAEFGRVRLVAGEWNKRFLSRVAKFPIGKRDEIDSVSGAFKKLVGPKPIMKYYNPNVHMKSFKKDIEEFNKILPDNVSVYIVLWMEKTGGIYGGCYLWSHARKKVKLYNEIFQPYPTTNSIVEEIWEKAVVSVERHANFVTIKKIFCNELMFAPRKSDVRKALQKRGVRPHQAALLDEHSAVHRTNDMMANNNLIIHSDCIETDVQLRKMAYDKNKIPDEYPLVRCLWAMEAYIRNEIREREKDMRLPPYSRKKMKIREKVRSGHMEPPPETKKVTGYEYLT